MTDHGCFALVRLLARSGARRGWSAGSVIISTTPTYNEAITVPTVPDGGTSAHDLARAIETWKQYSRTDGSVDTAGDLLLGYRAHA